MSENEIKTLQDALTKIDDTINAIEGLETKQKGCQNCITYGVYELKKAANLLVSLDTNHQLIKPSWTE